MQSSDFTATISRLAAHRFLADLDAAADGDVELVQLVTAARGELSKQTNPPVAEAVRCNLHLLLNHIVSNSLHEELIYQASWALTNIASGDSTACMALVNSGSHTLLVGLLTHPSLKIAEQAAWAVGNLAGEGPAVRDTLLQCRCSTGVTLVAQMVSLYDAARSSAPKGSWPTACNTVVWVLSNLCRGKPQPALGLVYPAYPFLKQVLREAPVDQEALLDALWAVSYLTDGPNERIQAAIDAGLLRECCERLLPPAAPAVDRPHDYVQPCLIPVSSLSLVLHLLPTSNLRSVVTGCRDWFHDIVRPDLPLYSRIRIGSWCDIAKAKVVVLRILGNIVTGDDVQTDAALQMGFLDVAQLLASSSESAMLRKELCWSLSNVTAGNAAQVAQVLRRPMLVTFVLEQALSDNIKIAKEAVWVISNAVCGASAEDVAAICCNGWLVAMVLAAERFRSEAGLLNVVVDGMKLAFDKLAAEPLADAESSELAELLRVLRLTAAVERAPYVHSDMSKLLDGCPLGDNVILQLLIPRIAFLSSADTLHPLYRVLLEKVPSQVAEAMEGVMRSNRSTAQHFATVARNPGDAATTDAGDADQSDHDGNEEEEEEEEEGDNEEDMEADEDGEVVDNDMDA